MESVRRGRVVPIGGPWSLVIGLVLTAASGVLIALIVAATPPSWVWGLLVILAQPVLAPPDEGGRRFGG
jgi:hypothetical protein